jgi:RNA polymerase sigma factor FliA
MSNHKRAATPVEKGHAGTDPQRGLWEEYARSRSPRIRKELELLYLDLVRSLAEQLSRRLPEGFLGLRRAVERFELRREVRFTTYAQSAIWGAMMDSLRRDDFGTRSARRQATLLSETRGALAQNLGRQPTDEETAEALGLPVQRIGVIARWAEVTTVTTMPATTDDRRFSLPADKRVPDPALEAQRQDLRELLLRGFAPMERLLIILYYFEEMTMREIGATLGISESRVSQMHSNLVVRIKADLERKRIEWR